MSPRVSKREPLPAFTQTHANPRQQREQVNFWSPRTESTYTQDQNLSPEILNSPHFKRFCMDKEGTTLRTFFSKYLPNLPSDEVLESYYLCYSEDTLLAISLDKNLFLKNWRKNDIFITKYTLKDAHLVSKHR